jgi:hypothetical protein
VARSKFIRSSLFRTFIKKYKGEYFMRNKMLFVVFSVFVILAVAVSPVGAVTDGELDGNGHPYVGLMVADRGWSTSMAL